MPIDPALVALALSGYPAGGATTLTTARPGLRARSASHAAFKAAEQHVQNVTALRTFTDPNLNDAAVTELRGELHKSLRQRTSAQFSDPLSGYVRTAERAAAAAAEAADRVRPKLDPESSAQALRTDQAWRNHIEPMLEAGKRWDQIIPTLDNDGLLAVERFAPGREARIRDAFHQHEVPAELAEIRAAAARRAIEVAPPEARELLMEERDAQTALEFVRTVSSWIENESDPVAVSIGLKNTAFRVGAQNPVDTSTEAQAAYADSLRQATP